MQYKGTGVVEFNYLKGFTISGKEEKESVIQIDNIWESPEGGSKRKKKIKSYVP